MQKETSATNKIFSAAQNVLFFTDKIFSPADRTISATEKVSFFKDQTISPANQTFSIAEKGTPATGKTFSVTDKTNSPAEKGTSTPKTPDCQAKARRQVKTKNFSTRFGNSDVVLQEMGVLRTSLEKYTHLIKDEHTHLQS